MVTSLRFAEYMHCGIETDIVGIKSYRASCYRCLLNVLLRFVSFPLWPLSVALHAVRE